MKVVKHNSTIWKDSYERRKDPFGREYYWFSGEYSETENSNDYDDICSQSYPSRHQIILQAATSWKTMDSVLLGVMLGFSGIRKLLKLVRFSDSVLLGFTQS